MGRKKKHTRNPQVLQNQQIKRGRGRPRKVENLPGKSYHENLGSGTAEVNIQLEQEIKSLEELILKCSIDTKRWRIDRWIQNFWNNKYQIKAWLVPKVDSEAESFATILKDYKSSYRPPTSIEVKKGNLGHQPAALVLSIPDFHLDKKSYRGKQRTIEQKESTYYTAAMNLALRAMTDVQLEEIHFIVGNDFFHTDNIQGQTTAGTQLEGTVVSWHEAYARGFDLKVKTITGLRACSKKVYVRLVNGNHSFTKEFYLLHALMMYFKEDKNIIFDIEPVERKIFTYGENFFGLTHGNCKNEKLPVTFSTEFYKEWGKCRFKEVLLGDKHTDRSTAFVTKNEVNGVQLRILPSLSPDTDKWHYVNQFTENIPRAVGLVYSPTNGKIAELYHNVVS